MNKIKDLLVKAGCKAELVSEICESLDQYKNTLREQFEADYAAKIDQAKKVCIEETEAHKRELARRLQIFLETKAAAIESQLARQSALNESEASTKLRNVKSLVEGVELNGESNGQVTAMMEKAKRQIQQLNEEKAKALELANKNTAIAEKVLKHNRNLMTENARLKHLTRGGTAVAEGATRSNGNGKRIDGGRKGAQPTTTRSTIVENQTRRPPPQPNQPNVRSTGAPAATGFNVNDIAQVMDEDLV